MAAENVERGESEMRKIEKGRWYGAEERSERGESYTFSNFLGRQVRRELRNSNGDSLAGKIRSSVRERFVFCRVGQETEAKFLARDRAPLRPESDQSCPVVLSALRNRILNPPKWKWPQFENRGAFFDNLFIFSVAFKICAFECFRDQKKLK